MANNPKTYIDKFLLRDVQDQNSVLQPPRTRLRFLGNPNIVDNPSNDSTDVTIPASAPAGHIAVTNATPGHLAVGTAQIAFVDSSAGTATLYLPNAPPVEWVGMALDTGGAFSASKPCSVQSENGAVTIEDPNSPGSYITNPKLIVASSKVAWMFTGTKYKQVV